MAKQATARMVPIEFPAGGLNLSAGFNDQPKGTTRDAVNILPFEPESGAGRGGQRPGLSRCCDGGSGAQIGGGNPITFLHQATLSAIPGPGLVGGVPGTAIKTYMAGAYGIVDALFHNWRNLSEAASDFHVRKSATPQENWFGLAIGSVGADDTTGLLTYTNGGALANGVPISCVKFDPQNSAAKSFAAVGFPVAGLDSTNKSYCLQFNCLSTMLGTANSRLWIGLHFGDTFGTETGNLTVALVANGNVEWYLDNVLVRTDPFVGFDGQPQAIEPIGTGCTYTFFKIDNGDGTWSSFLFMQQIVTSGPNPIRFARQRNGLLNPFTYTPTIVTANHAPAFGMTTDNTFHNGFALFWNAQVLAASPTLSLSIPVPRVVKAIACSNGNVYLGDINSAVTQVATAVLDAHILTQGDDGQGKVIMVDGTHTKVLDLATSTVSDLTATGGKGTVPAGCKLVRIWRDRLILANQTGFEQNVYMSRGGDYHDWLFGQDDVLSAIALNDSTISGRIGDPVTALIAATDDVLLISTDHSLFAVIGDPGAAGVVTVVSGEVGVLGANAWAVDPTGTIYFVGNAGFYAYQPGKGYQAQYSEAKNLAEGKVAQLFASIDRSTTVVTCLWDRDRYGCWIFLTPIDAPAGTVGTHLWFDERTGGFWKVQYPASVGPFGCFIYDGDGPVDRQVILGGVDGVIYKIDPTKHSDDGVAIESYMLFGPLRLADPFNQAQIIALEMVLGSQQNPVVNCTWGMQVGDDAELAFISGPTTSGTFTQNGRQPRQLTRSRGNTAYLKISNSALNTHLAFERGAVATLPGGPLR